MILLYFKHKHTKETIKYKKESESPKAQTRIFYFKLF